MRIPRRRFLHMLGASAAWAGSQRAARAEAYPSRPVHILVGFAPGGFSDINRTNAPIAVLGAAGIEAQVQDTDTIRLAYDLANGWQATYTASVFHQSDKARARSYLRDGGGNSVYAGTGININSYAYTIAASAFSNNVYDWDQTHLAQAVTVKSNTDSSFAWEFVASDYAYLHDNQRVPTGALVKVYAPWWV